MDQEVEYDSFEDFIQAVANAMGTEIEAFGNIYKPEED